MGWRLDGFTGDGALTWQYQHESGTGTVAFNGELPQEIFEGGTYTVTATFTATVTGDDTRAGLNTVIQALLRDETFPGTLQVLQQQTIGPVFPSVFGFVEVTGSWTIPQNVGLYRNSQTLPLLARGGNVIGDTVSVVAVYKKVQ